MARDNRATPKNPVRAADKLFRKFQQDLKKLTGGPAYEKKITPATLEIVRKGWQPLLMMAAQSLEENTPVVVKVAIEKYCLERFYGGVPSGPGVKVQGDGQGGFSVVIEGYAAGKQGALEPPSIETSAEMVEEEETDGTTEGEM